MNLRVGRANVSIKVHGCIDCGTEWSHAWEVAKLLTIVVAGKEHTVEIHRCGDCVANKPKLLI